MKDILQKINSFLTVLGWSRLVFITVLVYWCFLFFSAKRWENGELMVSDIKGYYAYVPAFLFNHDPSLEHMKALPAAAQEKMWVDTYQGSKFVRWPMGTALCYAPFASVAHVVAQSSDRWEANGYSEPYYLALGISALFFGLFGLWLVRKLCREFMSDIAAAMVLLILAFGTNLTFYATHHGPYSHIYSFWAIALFAWLTLKWHRNPTLLTSLFLGLISGLIVLIRPTNLVVALLFVFWGVSSWATLKAQVSKFWQHKLPLLCLLGAAFAVVFLQLSYWKFSVGHWFFDAYRGQGFIFDRPEFMNVLFSFRKGWLLYTPLMGLSIVGFFLLRKRMPQAQWAIPLVFLVHLYLVSSWHSWWYGDAYSQRPMVDIYPLLALSIGVLLHIIITLRRWWLYGMTALAVGFGLALNTFQFQQYKDGLIHYDAMTKEAYQAIWMESKYPPNYTNLILSPDLQRLANMQPEYISSHAQFSLDSTFVQSYDARAGEGSIPSALESAIRIDSTHPFSPIYAIPLKSLNDPNKRYRAYVTAHFYAENVTSNEQFTFFVSSVALENGHSVKSQSWPGEVQGGQRMEWTKAIDLWTPFVQEDSLKIALQYHLGPPIYLERFEVAVVSCDYPE